jgi:ASC-1-like (ASCH) protein
MQDKSKSEIVIRNMENSDVPFIVLSEKEQRKDLDRDMVKSEGVKNLLPFLNDDDIEEGVNFYQNIPEFHCVDEYGCVAFGLRITESKL